MLRGSATRVSAAARPSKAKRMAKFTPRIWKVATAKAMAAKTTTQLRARPGAAKAHREGGIEITAHGLARGKLEEFPYRPGFVDASQEQDPHPRIHFGIRTGEANRIEQRRQRQERNRQRRNRRQPVARHPRDRRDARPAHNQQHGMEQRIGITYRRGAARRHRNKQPQRHARQCQAENSRAPRIVPEPQRDSSGRRQTIRQAFQTDTQPQTHCGRGQYRALLHQPQQGRKHQGQFSARDGRYFRVRKRHRLRCKAASAAAR